MNDTTRTLPELSLVLLVGPSGAGKTTFAAKHFAPYEVLSSDHYRGVVSNDPNSLEATEDAFDALAWLAERRLKRGLLTVIDATNVRPSDRKRWVALARRYHVLPLAIVLDVPPRVALARNAERPDRDFGPHVVRRQASEVRRHARGLRREGFRYVHHLKGTDAIDAAQFRRDKPWTDRRDEHGPFDLIGDVHGCFDELVALLTELGWTLDDTGPHWSATHAESRRLLFLGDLVDRGPRTPDVLRLVMDLVEHGDAICVPGNHEIKLLKWLQGRKVRIAHGLQESIDQLATTDDAFRARVATFIDGLVSHFVLDDGKLVVAHAGMREDLAGRASGQVRQFALYGESTGEIDAFGLPVRYPWAEDYRGRAAVVYGHTPMPSAQWVNNTLCIDTGCVFGGALTALRWPERDLVSVDAARVYAEPIRPLAPEPESPSHDLLDLDDVFRARRLETRFGMAVRLEPERAATALEVVSRFTVDPRWLPHLPPTMSPSETSKRPDLLEHPDEAFAYYRKQGVTEVVCEDKHMGSRAMVLVGRTDDALGARFGTGETLPGLVLSRRGRRFFSDAAVEDALARRVRAAFDAAGLWDELDSDWALLDAELMPWSAKAQALLRDQYAPVGIAARTATRAAADVVRAAAARTEGLDALVGRLDTRIAAADAYTNAYRRYCWAVDGLDDLRLAPFHLLATEGRVHDDRDHPWHMTTLARLAEHDPLLVATSWRRVSLDDPEQVAEAVAWWEQHTAAGGEGMVVKPVDFVVRHKGRLVQPALKCRGREYLRIIYGPEYTTPDHLDRLRQRGVRRKRQLAIKEFALGLEALHRFVERQPLRQVHTCVLGILALESEPVDPRL
jgi:protein phosphatase